MAGGGVGAGYFVAYEPLIEPHHKSDLFGALSFGDQSAHLFKDMLG